MRTALLFFCMACIAGCGDFVIPSTADDANASSGDDDASADDTDAGSEAGVDAGPRDSGPRDDAPTLMAASLTSSAAEITQGQSVQFSLTVDDSFGMSDVKSAMLADPGGATYATFSAAGSWTMSVTLSWSDIQRVMPITFAPPSTTRTFVARVANRHGQTTSTSVSVTLYCAGGSSPDGGAQPGPSAGACNGTCTTQWASCTAHP